MTTEKQKRDQRKICCGKHLSFIWHFNTFCLAYIVASYCFNKMSTSSINRRILRSSAYFIKPAPSQIQSRKRLGERQLIQLTENASISPGPQQAISEFSCASVSKRVYVRNLSYENEFCMQFHFHANQSHSHKNSFALRLALKQRHKGTRKWPIFLLLS